MDYEFYRTIEELRKEKQESNMSAAERTIAYTQNKAAKQAAESAATNKTTKEELQELWQNLNKLKGKIKGKIKSKFKKVVKATKNVGKYILNNGKTYVAVGFAALALAIGVSAQEVPEKPQEQVQQVTREDYFQAYYGEEKYWFSSEKNIYELCENAVRQVGEMVPGTKIIVPAEHLTALANAKSNLRWREADGNVIVRDGCVGPFQITAEALADVNEVLVSLGREEITMEDLKSPSEKSVEDAALVAAIYCNIVLNNEARGSYDSRQNYAIEAYGVGRASALHNLKTNNYSKFVSNIDSAARIFVEKYGKIAETSEELDLER